MSLRFHNQLTKQVDVFTPLTEGRVTLYTCGPTVYNYPTVGNWAAYVYWDTLVRVLHAHELDVVRVMNITDVGHLTSDGDDGEDKLEKGAKREGKTAWEVAKYYTDDFLQGMDALNLTPPTYLPKATEYIVEQLELVRTLKEKGYTYQIGDGIYFDTAKFPPYDDFAGLDLEAQKAGARVEFNTEKKNPSDFALWKFTPAGETRDMEWETPVDILEPSTERPVVMGFPGWHLECSAMAGSLLGETIDIHTGGIDHIPVHHTNEIAQSEAAHGGAKFAQFWLHNNHLKVDGTKISKSLGNGYTLQDITAQGYDPLDVRMFYLQSHYRTEGNFTLDNLSAARNRRLNWRNVAALRHQIHDTIQPDAQTEAGSQTASLYAANRAVLEALSNDLNTPEALVLVDAAFDAVLNSRQTDIHQHALVSLLETLDQLLGLRLIKTTPDVSDDIKQLLIERTRARDNKDYARSDELRDALSAQGIAVRDTPNGSVWEYASA